MDAPQDEVEERITMVRNCARRLTSELRLYSVEMDDLVACGWVGLLEAEKRFDASYGVKLEAYAYPRIRGAMLDGLRGMGKYTRKVRMACARLARMDSVAAEAGRERAERGDPVDPEAMAGELAAVLGRLVTSYVVTSLAELERHQSPEEVMNRDLDKQRVRSAIRHLPEAEQVVLIGLYYEERFLRELGEQLGMTESGASRVHSRAIARLQERLVP